jgi:hypothetical protein
MSYRSLLTLLKTELVSQVDEDVLDLFLGQGNVGLLGPGRLQVDGILYISTAINVAKRNTGSRKAPCLGDHRCYLQCKWAC